jgi:hypothetical protein
VTTSLRRRKKQIPAELQAPESTRVVKLSPGKRDDEQPRASLLKEQAYPKSPEGMPYQTPPPIETPALERSFPSWDASKAAIDQSVEQSKGTHSERIWDRAAELSEQINRRVNRRSA